MEFILYLWEKQSIQNVWFDLIFEKGLFIFESLEFLNETTHTLDIIHTEHPVSVVDYSATHTHTHKHMSVLCTLQIVFLRILLKLDYFCPYTELTLQSSAMPCLTDYRSLWAPPRIYTNRVTVIRSMRILVRMHFTFCIQVHWDSCLVFCHFVLITTE